MNSINGKGLAYNTLLERIPEHIYASDNPSENGLYHTTKEKGLERKYIQLNPKNSIGVIVLDIDKPIGMMIEDEYKTLPQPNIVILNPSNQHLHIAYILEKPVHKNNGISNNTPIKFLQEIVYALTNAYKADWNYNGLTAKNPFCGHWPIRVIHNHLYTLKELAEAFTYEEKKQAKKNREKEYLNRLAEGRNCRIFETVRKTAYKEVREANNLTEFTKDIQQLCRAERMNDNIPITQKEADTIGKSIATWTWEHMKGDKFMSWSNERREKALIKIKAKKNMQKEMFAKLFDPMKMSYADIAKEMNISLSTAKRYGKELQIEAPKHKKKIS